MAWPTRSKCLAIAQKVGPVAGTLYSLGGPAAGHVWLIKNVTFFNGNASSKAGFFYLKRAGVSYCIISFVVPGASVQQAVGNWVAEAGDELQYQTAASFGERIEVGVFGANLG